MSNLCCPHCGGKNGYNQFRFYKCRVWSAWGDNDTDHVDYEFQSETIPRCEDCGKRVKKFVEELKKEHR